MKMKDNANPLIHQVKPRNNPTKRATDEEIRSLSVAHKSCLMALSESVKMSGDKLSIVQDSTSDIFGVGYIDLNSNFDLGPPQIEYASNEMGYCFSRDIPADEVNADEIFELLRDIDDPEHPNITLEQLNVVQRDLIKVDHNENGRCIIDVKFTPTIPHCSMATLIGLCLRVKLLRSLPTSYKCTVRITPGTHASEVAVNKQLADKERVAAAIENKHLLGVVNKCLK